MEKRLIYFVEDSKTDQLLFKSLFSNYSQKVACEFFPDGLSLFDRLETGTQKPDLIVLDFNLPFMNGYEIISVIRKLLEYRNISVVLISSVNNPKLIEDCMALGAKEFIRKSYNYEEVNEIISRLIAYAKGEKN